MVNPALSVDL